MADVKPTAATAAVKKAATTNAQPRKSGNAISWIAPIACLIIGHLIYYLVMGAASNFKDPANHKGPKNFLGNMYEGGWVVPILLSLALIVLTFCIERLITILKAGGSGNNAEFIRKVQYHLANKNVDAALSECDKQKGSVANVMKNGLKKYKEMIGNTELETDQKIMAIQKEVEEATALELPMLEKNLVYLSTIASVATLGGLFGTVLGMIRSFAALGTSGGASDASALAQGISEALYNTALGIGTSAIAIIMYNVFTTKIDGITYGIDESGFTLTQSFATNYK
jgi:biopolymer transport protein ExbB